jgi:hypothetical protein
VAQQTIFYSWQSDLPNGTNRSFIETCLNKAIKELQVANPRLDPCLDRDTANVPGSPDISATILDKINNCHIFVCDVSIIQKEKRPTPNPNVLFELGYAVKRMGWDRVICVANSHFGEVEALPFDVRQRRVKKYTLPPESADRGEIAKELTAVLRCELELIFASSQEEGERLQLQFGDIDTKTPLGKSLEHSAVFYSCDIQAIPDYKGEDTSNSPYGGVMVAGRTNRDYHRQFAKFVQNSFALRKVALVAYNGNRLPLNDVTMDAVFRKIHGLVVLDHEPYEPNQTEMAFMGGNTIASHFKRPGKLILNELPDRYEMRVEFGKIQAEANGWSDEFFIGTSETANLELIASLFADELSAPTKIPLALAFQMTDSPISSLSKKDLSKLRKR